MRNHQHVFNKLETETTPWTFGFLMLFNYQIEKVKVNKLP